MSMKARDLMTEDPEFVTPDDPSRAPPRSCATSTWGIVPIVDNP